MGAVWLAEDTRLHRQVALKMVRPVDGRDDASRARLMREAWAAAALNHPHIATVHDVLGVQDEVVIVFEYVEGETLYERIGRGRVPAPEAVEIACQIAKALAAAHAHGIVHRDLKPANVIVGAGGHVKVLDFGIARLLAVGTTETAASAQTSSGAGFIGTVAYAAPEQMVSSAIDERADIYALGVVLFELICGERPFAGHDPLLLASAKLARDAPPMSSTGQLVPPALEAVVASFLARDREQRPASAADALAQLRAVYGLPGTGALPARPASRLLTAVIGMLVLALAGFAALELWTAATSRADPPAPPVVAVLPLSNVSGDPSKDFVAAGIAESLISSLAALPTVTVLSRASVTEARGRSKDTASLTRELGATYLVGGSVQESGGTLRVSLNLVKADRSVAWGDTVEGQFERIFELQSRLASALTGALVVRVSASERERMNAQPTTSPNALSAYWQGKALLERADEKGNIAAAIAAFEQALKIDSRFALAHAGLGQSYRRKYNETRDPAWAQRAIDAATSALRLDPDRAEVRYVLALTLAGGGRHDEAIEELNRALAIQPNYEEARRQLGQVLTDKNQIDHAIVEFRRAIALRPNGSAGYSTMGLALLSASRYKEAAEAFRQAIAIRPNSATTHRNLGDALLRLGKPAEAKESYLEAMRLFEVDLKVNPTEARTVALLAVVARKAGLDKVALQRFNEAMTLAPEHPEVLYRGAALHALAGESSTALDFLERAIRRGYSRTRAIEDDDLSSLRSSGRFQTLVKGEAR